MTRILHNPRCSKSRTTLALLEEKGIHPEVILYLQTPPDADELRQIIRALGCSASNLLRTGEARYRELNIAGSDLEEDELIRLIADNPILLERPIVIHGDTAAIGRPPEKVLTLFEHSTRT